MAFFQGTADRDLFGTRRAVAWPKPTARRVFDVVGASVILIVTLPLIVVLAAALALTLRATPFFSQTRIGENGAPFRFLKLRTLPPAAPSYADKYEIRNVEMPKLARVLRATHLDELPQLFLVLSGRMSLVGPRPEMPQLHDRFDPLHRRGREAMKPGCAGLWQASVASSRLIAESPEYDLFYAEHASLRLDIWILWRTAAMMIGRGRPYELADVPGWARKTDDGVILCEDRLPRLAA